MVRIKEKTQDADAVTSTTFLTSINSWYKEDGIKVGVEKVGNLYPNKNDKKKWGVAVTLSILDDMEKCRARVIGDDGKVVMVEDETTGEERPKMEIIEDPDEVTFFFNVRIEDKEKKEFSVNPKASCFPLFNFAFQATGDLPEDNDKGFICNIDELKNSLRGIEFKAKAKKESFSGGNPYWVIIPSVAVDVEEVY
ncbi:MAG: hypothetical protein IJ258_11245 [Methanobrevibacter sp.]|uniref:hypothetical protein n=1 Tax=Methanobrevibacter sp. TaxID=66852 RepID=UPI0025DA92EC|nr:hypothetical protein [Methanobrevibacter sp.]MBQ8018653.1 hypothetical protein [Methanobrevibacter sp.]